MSTSPKTVLLTGASGVIGRAVAEELTGHHVIGLVHTDAAVTEVDEVISADVGQERLGLTEPAWRNLADRIDVIIHSAALTEWGQPRERYQAINIDGTARVVELARAADVPVHYVSTCFVHALERGALDQLSPSNVVAPYVWSKLAAEHLLAGSGVPHSIYRPTNLVGDSRTGASSRPQIVQVMSDWFCRGKAPYFPAHPGNLVDVVPLDVTAVTIARAVERDRLGELQWVTYGPEAMTVDQAQAILLDHARAGGRDLEPVSIVDPRRPLPIPLAQVAATSRAFLKVLIDVSEVTHASGGVLPTSMPLLRSELGVPDVSDQDAYRLSLKYWAEHRAARRVPASTNGKAS